MTFFLFGLLMAVDKFFFFTIVALGGVKAYQLWMILRSTEYLIIDNIFPFGINLLNT